MVPFYVPPIHALNEDSVKKERWYEKVQEILLPPLSHLCGTTLQDFKVNPTGAQPYATISMYGDLVESKGLGLLRADLTPNLTKKVR